MFIQVFGWTNHHGIIIMYVCTRYQICTLCVCDVVLLFIPSPILRAESYYCCFPGELPTRLLLLILDKIVDDHAKRFLAANDPVYFKVKIQDRRRDDRRRRLDDRKYCGKHYIPGIFSENFSL